MTSFLTYGWAANPGRLAVAVLITLGFARLARVLQGVDQSGAVAGGLVCFALLAGAGPGAFATLAALFVMTWLSTRLGYRRKQELGVAEQQEGRNAWQVLANLVVAAVAAVAFAATGERAWLVATTAALAEAATDTVASEIGQSRQHDARLITTGQRVPPGTDGGVTPLGTLAGLIAGVVIAIVATASGILTQRQMWIPILSGFVGMLADSLLGATLQPRGWLSNQAVNFFATLAAAVLAYTLCLFV